MRNQLTLSVVMLLQASLLLNAPLAVAAQLPTKSSLKYTPGQTSTGPASPTAIAQNTPKPARIGRNPIPGIVGTVNIRKPFKLFSREQLIHNLSFRDTPVREVISEIARRGNLNILVDKSVTGRITGDLRDITLNEAMDNVIAAAGLQYRVLDGNTVIVATLQAMVQLGLNRPMARAFKLSYAHPYDVAMILYASVFNRGYIPDFTSAVRSRTTNETENLGDSSRGAKNAPGGAESNKEGERINAEVEVSQTNRPDTQRTVRGSSRLQTQEGVGFNNASTDPGSQQIRSFQEIPVDYIVDQNGGGAIVIPDVKNRQVIVVGTADDLAIAEESIRLLDRRPKQMHIQASLIELNNQGIRQLGATLNLQGYGFSGSAAGNSGAPVITPGPGLGTNGSGQTTFNGVLGSFIGALPTIAGVTPRAQAASQYNYLGLGSLLGGHANVATFPTALNLQLNLLLQTNKAKVIANPSVVVADNTETLITIAGEVIHKITSTVSLGVVTTNVELTKAGIFLNVLPKVGEDGFITMRLRPSVSAPQGAPQTFGTTTVTLLNIREVMSQEVRIKNGQTLVIGGLFSEQEAAQLAKIPYLAETPVLGALFRNTLKGRNRDELLLLLTPTVVEETPTSLTDSAASPTM